MPQSVYVETSVVSYLTARRGRDLIVAARQEITREWWDGNRGEFDLFTSEVSIEEARRGDPTSAALRLAALAAIPQVDVTPEAVALAAALVREGILPEVAATDALHLAVATLSRMQVLLTWNCRHLANASLIGPVAEFLRRQGHEPPLICTPEYLLGERS